MSARTAAEGGFSLVSAIFLLVVLAALGAFAVRINVLQQQTVTAALRADQAFHAARSGIA
jgi:MSHA biogenesis protein MshP